jgi:hypothetical protein
MQLQYGVKNQRMPLQKKVYRATTAWFGRPSERGQRAKSTMVHLVQGNIALCGYMPHPTMQMQVCAPYPVLDYVECAKCKQKYIDANEGVSKDHRKLLDDLNALELSLEGLIQMKADTASQKVIKGLINNKKTELKKYTI